MNPIQRHIRMSCYGVPQKVAVIKLVRQASSLGLKEAKDLVEETMGDQAPTESEFDGSWKTQHDFDTWHADIIGCGVTILGEVDLTLTATVLVTEKLVGNAQALIIDCIMERAWDMARDLIGVLERHDGRHGDKNG